MNIRSDKFIMSRCLQPVSKKQYNFITHEFEENSFDCGKCEHCRMTRRNEWCTRMLLEAGYHKYCYFVTFTYDKHCDPTILEECNAVSCCCNSYNHYELMPLTLNKKHAQKMWKRLRKAVGYNNIKYVLVGEYGHEYGRPHFHAIVYSDVELTQQHFQDAWKLNGKFIGNVDFHLLKSNLTAVISNNETIDPMRYVTKYIQKEFKFEDVPTYRYHIKNQNSNEEFPTVKNKLSKEYIQRYKPFMLSSIKDAIGSGYLADNIERFKEGDYRLFGVQDKELIFPKYFYRKTKEAICPIKTFKQDGTMSDTPNRLQTILSFYGNPQVVDTNIQSDLLVGLSPKQIFAKNAEYIRYNYDGSQPYSTSEMSFYNLQNNTYNVLVDSLYYSYTYSMKQRKYILVSMTDADKVIKWLEEKWKRYLKFYARQKSASLIKQQAFRQEIIAEFYEEGDEELSSEDAVFQACYTRWREYAEDRIRTMKIAQDVKQAKYNNTKTVF